MITLIKSLIKSAIKRLAIMIFPAFRFSKEFKTTVLGSDPRNSPNSYHYYIGYYDIDPLNDSSQEIACQRVSRDLTDQIEPEKGDIGLLSLRSGEFKKIQETRALNWQLGSRVQWLDNEHLIYNDVENNFQVSKKVNIHTNQVIKKYSRAFWAISPNKDIGASLNFARISIKRPGYGYKGLSKDGLVEKVSLFNLNSGLDEYSIELSDILDQINFISGRKDPYLNHIAWSPCSTKILSLFHYHAKPNDEKEVYPIVYDLVKNTWQIIENNGFFSHHTWLDEHNILAYKKDKGVQRFCIWNMSSGWSAIKDSMPLTDGHPSSFKNSDKVIIDTYPNKLGKMKLYLGSTISNMNYKTLGYVINPPQHFGALRCDLHPRISKDNKTVFCDMPTNKGRRILMIEGKYV